MICSGESRHSLTLPLSSLLLLSLSLTSTTHAATTPQQVNQAIDQGKAYLWSQFGKTVPNSWEEVAAPIALNNRLKAHQRYDADQFGGMTGIAIYTLLISGEKPNDARLKAAEDWLFKADIIGTYALSMRCQVCLRMKTDAAKKMARQDFVRLAQAMKIKGVNTNDDKAVGLYNYVNSTENRVEHSVTNYAVLGAWACSMMDIEPPMPGFWELLDKAWRRDQANDGSWGYYLPDKGTANMTAAGIASLFITDDMLNAGRGPACMGNIKDPAIDHGIEWLSQHLNEIQTDNWWTGYGLYTLKHIGAAGGYKYLGTTNWFQYGADWFTTHQNPDGSWPDDNRTAPDVGPKMFVPSTCFGILFLVHGRAPVMMEKLQYTLHGDKANWNQRHRDLANLARWVGEQNEAELNWEIVNLEAPVEELHDAPILLIAGNQAISFEQKDLDKLRQFVEGGGLILGNADCASQSFIDNFKKMANQLFPKYEFRDLVKSDPSHPILTREMFQAKLWTTEHPQIVSMSNGARELCILLPQDPSAHWQTRAFKLHHEVSQAVDDIFLYTVEQKVENLKTRGDSYIVTVNPNAPQATHDIKLARLLNKDGNADPEPGGWRRMAAIMHNDFSANLTVEPVTLGDGKLTFDAYKVAHLTGTTSRLVFTPAESAEVAKFIKDGGTLIVDSCGGNNSFADSAQAVLGQLFAGSTWAPLKKDDPAISAAGIPAAFSGAADAPMGYRAFARSAANFGDAQNPHIQGLTVGGRVAILFSREDLSVGLVGEPVDGIAGYTPDTAKQLMAGMLLFASSVQQPTTAPAK